MDAKLGRLEKVDLRKVWEDEANKFTPWLAQEENLALLGKTVDIDLELEKTEKEVGRFSADILCKDTGTGQWVVIENQLGRTDHDHLGKLLTYAAGLDAVTVVWIAAPFTDEHRATLDWLNDITGNQIQFFGLEIEAWQIGDSLPAPKFNIVSKPNDWRRSITDAALTEAQQVKLEYWRAFGSYIEVNSTRIKPAKPSAKTIMTFSVGHGNFSLNTRINTRENWLQVFLSIMGPDAKPFFYLLQERKPELEESIGEPLEWKEHPGRKESHLCLAKEDMNPTDKSGWSEQHAWLLEKLEKFNSTFRPVVKSLNAEDWQPNSSDGEGE